MSDFGYHCRLFRKRSVYRVINPARYLMDWARVGLRGRAGEGEVARDHATKVLLASDAAVSTSEEQFNPFSFCRPELRDRSKVISTHLLITDVLRSPTLLLRPFDVVILKLSFRADPREILNIVRTIAGALNGRRLIYFDGDDDLCIQWPSILPYVDLYVKKQLFRDRIEYLKRFVGKSNLTDFVHRRYNYSFAEDPVATGTEPLAMEHLPKLRVGCNLASDRNILKLYNRAEPESIGQAKTNDVVFRGSVPNNNWMYYLRREIEPALERLGKSYRIIAPVDRVPVDEYYREMQRSRICISPFGYGEVCWRDFEAILCGCLVVKPDMSHVETNPDIFRPRQTYVPVRWDFSDLDEKCRYYLEHDHERQRIVDRAFNVLDEFYKNDGIVEAILGLLDCGRKAEVLKH